MTAEDLVGQVVESRYRVEEMLGRGGMGVVYRGRHIAIDRAVAIKVLNPTLSTASEMVQRFEREARAAGKLDHPNCVPVIDFGTMPNGTLFLVMEHVSGQSLATLLGSEGSLHPKRALAITRHVLRGLGHAHSLGIVHRDIKPDNVMVVARDDEPDFARVLDFGIAQLRDAGGGERLTQAGVAVGTPIYFVARTGHWKSSGQARRSVFDSGDAV